METLLHAPTSMAKRPCPVSSTATSAMTATNTGRLPNANRDLDDLLETFLSLADSPSLSVDLSFERILESFPCDADQSSFIDRALKFGTVLVEAANRAARKRSSKHNSLAWPLPPDLTIKVFSMLDTQSLCYAAASCSLFQKCAMDPLCYANIDLTTVVPKVNNTIVATMIQRAGKALQSLKLGLVPGPSMSPGCCQPMVYSIRNSVDASNFSWNEKKTRQGKEPSVLTRTCLNPLSGESTASGTLLRRLYLYNIERLDNTSLRGTLSACPSLLDLEIVGLHVELRQTLESVSMNCPLIERLFFESSKSGRDDSLKSPTCVDLVNNCPNLTSLALRGFKLHDCKIRILVKGFQKLKYIDFSTSYSITGNFLRNMGSVMGGNLLEVLILRDCMHLKEMEVARLLTAILAGDYKFLRHLDISNREGLASEGDWYHRCYNSSVIPVRQVIEARPDMCLLAEFPPDGSFVEIEQMIDSDLGSEISWHSQLSIHASDGSFFMSTSESSYSSDQSSGNEEGQDSGYLVHEESADEVDYPVV